MSTDVFALLVDQSQKAAALFASDREERRSLRGRSPYRNVIVVACMDERCRSIEHDLGLPYGYLRFMRTKGARVQLSHFQVQDTLNDLLRSNDSRPILMLFTAHYSHAHPSHSCAGWDNNLQKALAHQERVAEVFARLYKNYVHTLVCAYETDQGLLMIPHADGSYRTIVSLHPDHQFSSRSFYGKGYRVDERARNELLSYSNRILLGKRGASSEVSRELFHSATCMHVGSGFEFERGSGSAVMVGLHSPTLIDDVALGVERIILPEAARKQGVAHIAINRLYDPELEGEHNQAAEWVHAVLEDIMCLFRSEVDEGKLRIMTSVSTFAGGFEPIMCV